jgi:hypothetical protein
LLSDMLISSPILAGDRGMGIPDEAMGDGGVGAGSSGGAGGSGAGFEFGVDPSLDPELAMVRLMYFQCARDFLIYEIDITMAGPSYVDARRASAASR